MHTEIGVLIKREKRKAIQVTGGGGLYVCAMSMIPHCIFQSAHRWLYGCQLHASTALYFSKA
jgi:hypothetical protein